MVSPESGAGSGGGVIGIGMDLVDVDRLRKILARTDGFRDRVFTDGEQEYAERANDSTERYAARFAAKEAVMKSLGLGLGAMTLREIEVVKAESGRPLVVLHGDAAKTAAEHGVAAWEITLSHTHVTASAMVVALG